jgi:hypothetical protein
MKANVKTGTATLMAAMLFSATVFAQVPPPPPGPGAPGPERPPVGRLRGPREAGQLIVLATITGNIEKYTTNDDFIVDGFTLNASTTLQVKFPAHLAAQIMNVAKEGSAVTVTGFQDTDPEGVIVFHLNTITAGGKTITDTPPPAPPTPRVEEVITISGKVTAYSTDRALRNNGLILDNGVIVHFPPHMAEQVTAVAPVGSNVTVQGGKRTLPDGVVQLKKTTVLEAKVLTAGGKQYLIR